jgi:hypothetical protein
MLRLQAEQARHDRYVSHRDAARALARRGDWVQALHYYDLALPQAGSERLLLEVERVRILFPLGKRGEIERELDRLRAQDLGPLSATVSLWRADLALATENNVQPTQELLRQALKPNTLSPADQAYAQALLAESPAQTMALLNECLKEDPLHHRASALLIVVRIATWEFAAAQQQIEYHQRLFANDPAGLFLQAWNESCRRQSQSAASVAELRKQFGSQFSAQELRNVEDYLRLQGELLQAVDQLRPFGKDNAPAQSPVLAWLQHWQQESFAGLLDGVVNVLAAAPAINSLAAKIAQVHQRFGSRPLLGQFGLLIPSLPWFSAYWQTLEQAMREYSQGRPEAAAARLAPLIERQPDAMLLLFRALFASSSARQMVAQGKPTVEIMQRFTSAAEDGHRASRSPAISPQFQRSAFLLAALLDAFDYHCREAPDSDFTARVAENFRRLRLEVALQPDEHARFTVLIASQFDQLLPEWALPLLHDWRQQDPKNTQPLRLLAQWELRARNYAAALQFADQVLAQSPRDAAMRRVQQDARREIEALLKTGL